VSCIFYNIFCYTLSIVLLFLKLCNLRIFITVVIFKKIIYITIYII